MTIAYISVVKKGESTYEDYFIPEGDWQQYSTANLPIYAKMTIVIDDMSKFQEALLLFSLGMGKDEIEEILNAKPTDNSTE